ncbi:MAG: DUF1836 domain-containing protein [Lachnospiraceae bacterium]|jgi:hypothetical protein|nr:DUF1836 domain-containing protein [Lachnospiraceae bacterium]
MEEIKELKEQLSLQRPTKWEEMPDIELYMDQVISYMTRQHVGVEGKETPTSAMVNNYTKMGLMPRANGKKYNRDHIAHLTAICLLKQVLSINNVGTLLKSQLEEENIQDFYARYSELLNQTCVEVGNGISEEQDVEGIKKEILRLAVESYANRFACLQLLKILDNKSE